MSGTYSATQPRPRAVLQTAGPGGKEENQPEQGMPAAEGEDCKAGPATLDALRRRVCASQQLQGGLQHTAHPRARGMLRRGCSPPRNVF